MYGKQQKPILVPSKPGSTVQTAFLPKDVVWGLRVTNDMGLPRFCLAVRLVPVLEKYRSTRCTSTQEFQLSSSTSNSYSCTTY